MRPAVRSGKPPWTRCRARNRRGPGRSSFSRPTPRILHLRTVVIIPFTTNLRWARSPFCVAVSAGDGGLASDSVALCHQIRACDKARLLKRLGQLADATMVRIEQAVQVTLGM